VTTADVGLSDIRSLGYRTDLALLTLGGSTVQQRDGYLVVRTPANPLHWWGNFLLLPHPPSPGQTALWLDRFAAEIPGARHVAFGVDGTDGRVEDLQEMAEAGLVVEAATVMTATAVHEPPHPNRDAEIRRLATDDDWAQLVDLRVACNENGEDPPAYREFSRLRAATNRALVGAGHGAWFGAFEDGRLRTSMGLLRASEGLARFQSVETHPDARRRGLAGTLVHHVSRYGLDELGASTLVMVADPGYSAIRIYRSVGFVDGGSQLQAERAPAH
jgi:ribosomal protein S18 acetylase RimI-like enzyme